MNRNDLIDKIIELSPSLPGARQLTADRLEKVDTEALQRQADRLEEVAKGRTVAAHDSADRMRELAVLRDERAVLVSKMRNDIARARDSATERRFYKAPPSVSISRLEEYVTTGIGKTTEKVFAIAHKRFEVEANDPYRAAAMHFSPGKVKPGGPQTRREDPSLLRLLKSGGKTIRNGNRLLLANRRSLSAYISGKTAVAVEDVGAVLKELDVFVLGEDARRSGSHVARAAGTTSTFGPKRTKRSKLRPNVGAIKRGR